MALFDNVSTGVDWSAYTDSGLAYAPNAGAVPVNRPAVDTGGNDWGSWFDRIVGAAVVFRNAGSADARATAYPNTGYTAGYAGQTAAAPGAINTSALLILGGIGVVAFLLMKA